MSVLAQVSEAEAAVVVSVLAQLSVLAQVSDVAVVVSQALVVSEALVEAFEALVVSS